MFLTNFFLLKIQSSFFSSNAFIFNVILPLLHSRSSPYFNLIVQFTQVGSFKLDDLTTFNFIWFFSPSNVFFPYLLFHSSNLQSTFISFFLFLLRHCSEFNFNFIPFPRFISLHLLDYIPFFLSLRHLFVFMSIKPKLFQTLSIPFNFYFHLPTSFFARYHSQFFFPIVGFI